MSQNLSSAAVVIGALRVNINIIFTSVDDIVNNILSPEKSKEYFQKSKKGNTNDQMKKTNYQINIFV